MLKFVFIVTVWQGQFGVPHVEDYNLTGEDCIARMVAYAERDPSQSWGVPSCEIDHAPNS